MLPSVDNGCRKWRGKRRIRCLLGICCILAGVLVVICFVPTWMVAILVAFLLTCIGVMLIGL